MVISKRLETVMSEDGYDGAMARVRGGMAANVWQAGTLAEKRAFAEAVFYARVSGVKRGRTTGRMPPMPDFEPGQDGYMKVVVRGEPELSHGRPGPERISSCGMSRGDLAAARFDFIGSEDDGRDLGK